MANIVLSARSASDWTDNELTAFKVQVNNVTASTFFRREPLPEPQVSQVIILNERRPQIALTREERLFFRYMKDAETGEESLVDDFAAFILALLKYDEPEGVIHQRKELSFIMCGSRVDAKPDVCVMSEAEYLLLVQENKRGTSRTDPEPQLIAQAIAAFYQNNLRRKRAGQPQLDSQTIPAITMVGVVPTFYLIPVTSKLVQCVQAGMYPSETTIVQRCVPPVDNPETYPDEGLVPLPNRVVVMKCFEAFKDFVGI